MKRPEYPNARTLGPAVAGDSMPSWLARGVVRFLASWTLDPETGCHIWNGRTSAMGYGRFGLYGICYTAHRFAFEIHHRAPIAPGLVLDHLCRNRACVNPEHLEPVAQVVNIRRGEGGRKNAGKTHCPAGHEYTADNTYVIPATGSRTCRTCQERRRREYEERRSRAG